MLQNQKIKKFICHLLRYRISFLYTITPVQHDPQQRHDEHLFLAHRSLDKCVLLLRQACCENHSGNHTDVVDGIWHARDRSASRHQEIQIYTQEPPHGDVGWIDTRQFHVHSRPWTCIVRRVHGTLQQDTCMRKDFVFHETQPTTRV